VMFAFASRASFDVLCYPRLNCVHTSAELPRVAWDRRSVASTEQAELGDAFGPHESAVPVEAHPYPARLRRLRLDRVGTARRRHAVTTSVRAGEGVPSTMVFDVVASSAPVTASCSCTWTGVRAIPESSRRAQRPAVAPPNRQYFATVSVPKSTLLTRSAPARLSCSSAPRPRTVPSTTDRRSPPGLAKGEQPNSPPSAPAGPPIPPLTAYGETQTAARRRGSRETMPPPHWVTLKALLVARRV
jgi:hypothetical protein